MPKEVNSILRDRGRGGGGAEEGEGTGARDVDLLGVYPWEDEDRLGGVVLWQRENGGLDVWKDSLVPAVQMLWGAPCWRQRMVDEEGAWWTAVKGIRWGRELARMPLR